MPEHDHRRLGQPELRRGQHPAVTRDQLAVLGHEAGHGPAELGHAGGELRDLVGAVHLRVLRVGLQALERPLLDPLRSEAQRHGGRGSSVEWMPVASGLRMPVWTPRRVQQPPVLSGQNGSRLFRLARDAFGSGFRVASQKFGPVAGDAPRFARQHTFAAGKDPYNRSPAHVSREPMEFVEPRSVTVSPPMSHGKMSHELERGSQTAPHTRAGGDALRRSAAIRTLATAVGTRLERPFQP